MATEASVKKQELTKFEKHNFCNQVLKSDNNIRSAALVNINGTVGALIHQIAMGYVLLDESMRLQYH